MKSSSFKMKGWSPFTKNEPYTGPKSEPGSLGPENLKERKEYKQSLIDKGVTGEDLQAALRIWTQKRHEETYKKIQDKKTTV